MQPSVYAIATMDTKGVELAFVADCIRKASISVVTVDVGTLAPPTAAPDISRTEVLACHPNKPALPDSPDRGTAVSHIGDALVEFLRREHAAGKVSGVIGLGGSGGTAIIAPAMRALPIGLPKLLVSTVASGNVAPYVGCCDLTMMYSVVDIAGLNRVSRTVLANAARAIAAMSAQTPDLASEKPAIAMTMFGVTTPCVTAVRESLDQQGFDCLVFHATGAGGQAMEKLVESGLIAGVLDITTTEVADEVVGGVFPAGPARFDAILNSRVPYVVSLGAIDMVNFGSLDTVPAKFRGHKLQAHNAQVTLMRTTPDENRACARWIAEKLNRSVAPLTVVIPEKGVSGLDIVGGPFFDPEADGALFDELEKTIVQTPARKVRRIARHINEPEFATALLKAFHELWEKP